jgi:hypothetical protein
LELVAENRPRREIAANMLSASLVLLLPNAAGFCPPGIIAAHPLAHARVEAPIVGRLGGESISRRSLAAVAAAAVLLPRQAMAETTLVTRQQSYTRYVPRVERGRDYWAGGLRKLIATGDWKGISAALEKKVPQPCARRVARRPPALAVLPEPCARREISR